MAVAPTHLAADPVPSCGDGMPEVTRARVQQPCIHQCTRSQKYNELQATHTLKTCFILILSTYSLRWHSRSRSSSAAILAIGHRYGTRPYNEYSYLHLIWRWKWRTPMKLLSSASSYVRPSPLAEISSSWNGPLRWTSSLQLWPTTLCAALNASTS